MLCKEKYTAERQLIRLKEVVWCCITSGVSEHCAPRMKIYTIREVTLFSSVYTIGKVTLFPVCLLKIPPRYFRKKINPVQKK